MAYYLSYILNTDNQWGGVSNRLPKGLYHASLALTEHNPPEAPKIIAKIGLLNSSQIELEDFISPTKQRKFYHKTYPITQEQMAIFMHKLNQDRKIGLVYGEKDAEKEKNLYPEFETIKPKQRHSLTNKTHQMKSVPRGPRYNLFLFNCKTYALSVMKEIGIVDQSLNNWLIDDPGTGKLMPFEFAPHPDPIQAENNILVWKTPMQVTRALNLKQLKHLDHEERRKLEFSLKLNDFNDFIKNSIALLETLNPNKVSGLAELLVNLKKINSEIEESSAQYNGYPEYINNTLNQVRDEDLEHEIMSGLAKHEQLAFKKYLKQHEGKNLRKNCTEFLEYLKRKTVENRYQAWWQQTKEAIHDFEHRFAKRPHLRQQIVHAIKSALNYLGANFKISSIYKAKKMLYTYTRLNNDFEKPLKNLPPAPKPKSRPP